MNTDNGRLNFAAGIDNSGLRADAEQSKNILQSITKTAVQEGDNIDRTFSNIGKTIAGVFTVQQAASFAKKVVEVRGEIESLEKSFEILAGKTQGKKLFGEIKDFAVTTPMAMGDLAKGAQTLLSFNVAAEDVMPIMRAIGDIAMGDAQKFNSLTLAFAQMQSTGKLMGQDLLQMINAGFNPLSIISEKTGKSIGALKEEMAAGAISADMITQAFMDATSEGGKFHGMMETQSKGIKGSISNLEGAIEDMFNSIGESSQGIITGSIQTAQKLVENYDKVGRILKEFIIVYGTYKAALIATNAVQKFVISLNAGWTASELLKYKALLLVEKAQKLLNATMLKNPYVLAAAAIAGLVYALYKAYHAEDQTRAATEDHAEAIDNLNKKYEDEKQAHESVISLLNDETASRITQIQALESLDEPYRKIIEKYQDEKGHISDVIALQEELNEARANAKLKENSQQLTDYETTLNDYKKLKYANENGWDLATAGTNNNVNDLLADQGLLESNSKFLEEKISYWTKMVEQQREVVSSDKDAKEKADLMDLTDEELIAKKQEIEVTFDLAVKNARNSGRSDEEIKDVLGTIENDASYQAVIKEMERRSAGTPDLVKNRAYWEQYMKEQQTILNAMTEEELLTEKASEIKANIIEAQSKIDAYNAKESKDTTDQEIAERNKKILQYKEAVSREARQAQLDIRQAEIDAMQEGVDKELKQNELNYDRLIEANIRRQEDMVEALRDVKELEWENKNPKAKEQGMTFDRSSVTADDLSSEQLKILQEYERVANELRVKSNKECIDKILTDIMTYEQKRTEVAEEYEQKRKALYIDGDVEKGFIDGATQGNVEELDMQEQAALSAIDEEFAQREITYQAWCESIADKTLQQLQDILAQVKEELKQLEESGTADSKSLSVARAKVTTAEKQLNKASAKAKTSPDKRSIEEWNELREALEDCCSTFTDLGDAVGGVAGDIISTTGNIMTSTLSVVNGIVQLVTMSATGMQGTATTAATAISTVEKASVILAVISAAIQIAMRIINLFNTDDKKQEEIEELQKRIDQLQWELDNADAVMLQENSFKAMDKLKEATIEARKELFKLRYSAGDIQGAFYTLYSTTANNNELLVKTIKKVADAYANVEYTADKALGNAKYDNARTQLENLAQQQLHIQEQIAKEQSMKKPDNAKIEEYEQTIQEKGLEMATLINELVEDIMGGTAVDMANELGDAFFEAFQDGEDYAEAWGNKVNEIVADIVKRMLINQFLEQPLGEIFNKYKSQWFTDGVFQYDAFINSMSNFSSDLNNVNEDFMQAWESLPEDVKEMFAGTVEREASEQGIATASQESVDELNGRATAIQGHTYSICENTKMIVDITVSILESVANIEMYSERIANRIDKVETTVNDVRQSFDEIIMKGIKIQ